MSAHLMLRRAGVIAGAVNTYILGKPVSSSSLGGCCASLCSVSDSCSCVGDQTARGGKWAAFLPLRVLAPLSLGGLTLAAFAAHRLVSCQHLLHLAILEGRGEQRCAV